MKSKRRQGVTDAPAPQAIRVNVRVDAEARKRLAIHCAMTGLEPGEVITRLILSLRDWSMPVNLSARATNTHRPDRESTISPDAPESPLEAAA